MMTGLGMLTGSTLATNGGGSCMSNALCGASRVSDQAHFLLGVMH